MRLFYCMSHPSRFLFHKVKMPLEVWTVQLNSLFMWFPCLLFRFTVSCEHWPITQLTYFLSLYLRNVWLHCNQNKMHQIQQPSCLETWAEKVMDNVDISKIFFMIFLQKIFQSYLSYDFRKSLIICYIICYSKLLLYMIEGIWQKVLTMLHVVSMCSAPYQRLVPICTCVWLSQ